MGITFEGEPPFDLGVAQSASAQVLDATRPSCAELVLHGHPMTAF